MPDADPFAALAARSRMPDAGFDTRRVQAVLDHLGNPERDVRIVHVAGTNGKGSVVALVDAALRAAGHRVGRFTSPPTVTFADQVKVDGRDVPAETARAFLDAVAPLLDGEDAPSGFELLTALAAWWWREEGVDVAVVEAGLGGARDATNAFPRKIATVVTNVLGDHLDVIGPAPADAAREKAGIARDGVPFVTGAEGDALGALTDTARAAGADPVRVLHADFDAVALEDDLDGVTLGVSGLARAYPEMRVALAGEHQAANAGLALAALEACDAAGLTVPVDACVDAFKRVRWPGRLQHFPGTPGLLVDGAHNPAGVAALVTFLQAHDVKPVLLFGCLADKQWMDMVYALAPQAKAAVVTRPPSPRALDTMESAREFSRAGIVATRVEEPEYALATAFGQAGDDGLVLVTGSTSLTAWVLAKIGEEA